MRKKYLSIYFMILFVLNWGGLTSCKAQSVMVVQADKSNHYGIVYVLPKSEIALTINYRITHFVPGKYADYASAYMGKAATNKSSDHIDLLQIQATSVGIPDTSQYYLVKFKKKPISSITLTESRLLAGINIGTIPYHPNPSPLVLPPSSPSPIFPQLPNDFALATTDAAQAKVIADYIYKCRSDINDYLSSDNDNAPQDPKALDVLLNQLRHEEKSAMQLFYGHSDTTYKVFHTRISVDKKNESPVAFRISDQLGILSPTDLRGAPVYFSLKDNKTISFALYEMLNEKDYKHLKGIVYNVPGEGRFSLQYEGKEIYQTVLPITQFGLRQVLSEKMINDKKNPIKIFFNPETGEIRAIEHKKNILY